MLMHVNNIDILPPKTPWRTCSCSLKPPCPHPDLQVTRIRILAKATQKVTVLVQTLDDCRMICYQDLGFSHGTGCGEYFLEAVKCDLRAHLLFSSTSAICIAWLLGFAYTQPTEFRDWPPCVVEEVDEDQVKVILFGQVEADIVFSLRTSMLYSHRTGSKDAAPV